MSYFNEPEKADCCQRCSDGAQECLEGCADCTTSCKRNLALCLVNCCSYGTPAPIDSGSEVLPPWRKLWVEFVNRVTWHGLKYTELRSRFIIRRFIWTIAVLIAVSLFLYLNSVKLMYLLTYPVTINMNVLYNNSLPFPAITICNPNRFRLTALQELGLLDLMVNDSESSNCISCEEYVLYTEICWAKKVDSQEFFSLTFTEITRPVCMTLCSDTYDTKCSGFFYYRFNRSCLLSSYTGEWIDDRDPPCPAYNGTEFYRRNRKINYDAITCTFEERSCLFENKVDNSDSWILGEASNSPVAKDNTLDLGSGHIVSLLASEQKPGYKAEFTSPYLNTTDLCFELFFWFQADKANIGEVPTLSISVVNEEKVRTLVNTTKKFIQDWTRFFVRLPSGINQIVVEGVRANGGISGIALDDINVRKCTHYSNYRNCKFSRKGVSYMGNVNVSTSGESCLRWDQVNSPLVYKLPDQFARDAVNYCRYIPQENWEEPSCFVRSGDSVKISPCHISFCSCQDNSSFTCDSGLCLPSNLLCNGVQDCIDGTDEEEACAAVMKLGCDFDKDFVCGYKSDKVGSLSWMRRSSSDLIRYTSTTIYHNVSTLAYMMFLDSTYGQIGDQVQLISPLTNFTKATLVSFDYIMTSTSDMTDNSVSGLYLYQYSVLRTPLQLLFKKTNFNDTKFITAEVCAPPGQYHLMFLGAQGRPYEQAIALPAVQILGECSLPIELQTGNAESSVNCVFSSICGYTFLSSSAYLNYNFDYTKDILSTFNNGPACANTFNGVEGTILSPGYPNKYPDNMLCSFEILEPQGATIIVNFVEFSIEAESDCLYDRLEVYDPVANITRFFCGNTIPPPITSRGNRLRFSFRSDGSDNAGKFKLSYQAKTIAATDFSLIYKYSGPSLLHRYNQIGRLMSPMVRITSTSCLVAEVIVLSSFKVIIAHKNIVNSRYTETIIFSTPRSLGKDWHKLFLDIDPSKFKGLVVAILQVEIDYTSTSEPAAVKEISLVSGACRDSALNPALACDFNDINQCGYLDSSMGDVHWTRIYNEDSKLYFMSAYFRKADKDTAILRSARISIDSQKCISFYYDISGSFFEMEISSTLSTSAIFRNQLTTDDAAIIRYDLQKGVQEILLKVYPPSSDEHVRSEDVEVNIQKIVMIDGSCPTYVEKQSELNCDFDNLFICNFKISSTFGTTWAWLPYESMVTFGDGTNDTTVSQKPHVASPVHHGSVMMFNQSLNNYLGVLTSPLILLNRTTTINFEALASGMNYSSLQVFYGFSMGQVTGKIFDAKFDEDLAWKNFSICLPARSLYLFFVARVAPSQFILLDNIVSIPDSCTPRIPEPNQVCSTPGTSLDCPSTLHSWSSSFEWINTSAIQSNFNPDQDGCLYVYDRSRGSFQFRPIGKNEENRTECDIYIRGKGRMTVTLTFPQFEAKDCSSQYVEVWERKGNSSLSLLKVLCKNDTNSTFNFVVDDLIQLHVMSTKGYPHFVMIFSYSVTSPNSYSSGLYYTPGLDASQLKGVATWVSPIRELNSNNVCFMFDFSLPLSSLEIQAFYQFDGFSLRTMTVYSATRYKGQQHDWSNGTVQVTFDPPSSNPIGRLTVQFLFIFSLDLDVPLSSSYFGSTLIAAINNVRLTDSECSAMDGSASSSPPICLLDSKNFCGFHDESRGVSRWTRVSLRSALVRSGDCRSKEDGSTYTGIISNTISGRSCQRWDSQFPQKHSQDVSEYFPDDSILLAANKCRNPNNPFIPRSCWCYTMDVKQRREYCDIPLCLDKYFQVEFSTPMSSATLVSSAFSITSSYCLAFQYIIISPFVQLELHSTDSTGNDNILEVFSMKDQFPNPTELEPVVFISKAPVGYVTLKPGTRKIKFVAKKLDNQGQLNVLLSNITSYTGSCSSVMPGRLVASNKVPYKGPIKNRNYFINQIFDQDLNGWNILNLTEVLSHQKKDIIQKCSYDDTDCKEEEIVTRQTDIGQCYTFNKNALRTSTSSGLEYGAKFILNIEQYEHVTGFTSGEGIKLQLHNHNDIPSMKDLSVAALPGVHNLGIASYTRYENLEAPYGKCGMYPLDYYDLYDGEPYTEARCKLERKTKRAERKCGCKDAYMPGFSKFCNLNKTMMCLKGIVGRTLASQCPTPCILDSYAIQISQIGLSGLAISDLLDNRSVEIKEKYLTALNLRHRVGTDMTQLLQSLEYFLSKLNEFEDNLYFSILDSQTSNLYHLEASITALIQLSINDIGTIGKSLITDLEQNFVRFGSSRLEYLENFLAHSYFRLAYLKDLGAEANSSGANSARDWQSNSVNQTMNSLLELSGVLNTYDYITGTDTLLDCTDSYSISLHDKCKCDIKLLATKVEPSIILMKQAYDAIEKNSGSTSSWTNIVTEAFVVDLMGAMNEAITCSTLLQSTMNNLKSWLLSGSSISLRNVSQSINPQSILININSARQWMEKLKSDYSLNVITKMQLAQRLSGDEVDGLLRNISNVVLDITQNVLSPLSDNIFSVDNSVKSNYQTLLNHFQSLYNITRDKVVEDVARNLTIWRKPIANHELPEDIIFMLKSEETWQVWPVELTLSDFYPDRSKIRLTFILDRYFDSLKNEIQDFTTQLNGFHDDVKNSMASIETELKDYLAKADLNEEFLRSNFLMLDIYYGDMKYNDIIMKSAYGWIDFFSNVGGYFGLLMGCSVMTMCEVLDFFLYHSAVKIYERIEQSRRKRRHVIHVDPDDSPYHQQKGVRFSDHKLGDIAEEAEESPPDKKFRNPLNFNL